jgi:HK97 family phage prohead protease
LYETKHAATVDLKADEQGHIEAVFSTFGVVDSDGDILVREAFTDGQAVPLVWSHDWSMPIGKGTIRTDEKRAIFDGQFFTDTSAGLDAYRTVKAMGELQEFSWGFRILDAEPGQKDGQPIRTITKAEVFEVSPVLVGANRETYTLALKGRRRLSRGQIEGAITVLQALLGDDAAEEPDEAAAIVAEASEADPVQLLRASVEEMKAATDDDILAGRERLSALLADLGSVRGDIEALMKRADQIGAENPRELLRQFRRIEGLYGPTPSNGRLAVQGAR